MPALLAACSRETTNESTALIEQRGTIGTSVVEALIQGRRPSYLPGAVHPWFETVFFLPSLPWNLKVICLGLSSRLALGGCISARDINKNLCNITNK